MDFREIMKKIVSSTTYKAEVGTAFQLGLPQFEIQNGELLAVFYPHLERCVNGVIGYYAPQYELKLVYPFRHIVLFRDLSYTGREQANLPVSKVSVQTVEDHGKALRGLFTLAGEIVQCRKDGSDQLQLLISEYDKQFQLLTQSMEVQAIYGGAYDPHSGL